MNGRDRGACGGDEEEQVARVRLDVRRNDRVAHRAPTGMGQDRGDRIGEERDRHQHEHALRRLVRAADDEQPHDRSGDRNRHVLRDVSERQCGADPDELADADAEVGDEHRHGRERRPAHPVLLADQLRQPLSRDCAHPCRHLLHDDEGDGDQHHHPEQVVAVLCADRRVGGDPAGVVAGVGGDQPGPEKGEERDEARRGGVTRAQPRAPAWKPAAHEARGSPY